MDPQAVIDEYLEKGNTSTTQPSPPPATAEENLTAFLDNTGAEVEETPAEKAARQGNTVAKEQVEENEKQEEQRAEDQAAREQAARQGLTSLTQLNESNPIARGADFIASQPTPGGVGLLLAILIFFVWVIVPVNDQGDTRLKLLYLTLVGRTKLKDEYKQAEIIANPNVNTGDNGAGGSFSGDFSQGGGGVPVTYVPTLDIPMEEYYTGYEGVL